MTARYSRSSTKGAARAGYETKPEPITKRKPATKKGKMPPELLERFKSKGAKGKPDVAEKRKERAAKREERMGNRADAKADRVAKRKADKPNRIAERKEKKEAAKNKRIDDRLVAKKKRRAARATKNGASGIPPGVTPSKKKAVARDKGLAKGEAKVTKDADRRRKTTAPKQVQPTKGIKHVGQERKPKKK